MIKKEKIVGFGRTNPNPAIKVITSGRPDPTVDNYLDQEDEEDDQDLSIAGAGGMVMAQRTTATANNSTPVNRARYTEYKPKYGAPAGRNNEYSGAWAPFPRT